VHPRHPNETAFALRNVDTSAKVQQLVNDDADVACAIIARHQAPRGYILDQNLPCVHHHLGREHSVVIPIIRIERLAKRKHGLEGAGIVGSTPQYDTDRPSASARESANATANFIRPAVRHCVVIETWRLATPPRYDIVGYTPQTPLTMSPDEIALPVRALINRHIRSMDHAEVVLYLARHPDQPPDADEVAAQHRWAPGIAAQVLSDLTETGLATGTDGRFQLSSTAVEPGALEGLAALYHRHPVTLVRAVFASPVPMKPLVRLRAPGDEAPPPNH
jgi:hypothetical protein